MKVLFVCTGNTCRSPMLEFAFRHYLAAQGITDIDVDSAGVLNREKSMSLNTVAVLKAHSVPCIERASKFCSEKEISCADLVITVTDEQAGILQQTYSCNAYNVKKIISMRDVVGYDIPDPFGQGYEAYEKTYRLINDALPKIWVYIKNRH